MLSQECQRANGGFGPAISSNCNGGFDFTLFFEETILTILPLGIIAIWSAIRIFKLRKIQPVVRRSWLLTLKLVAYSVFLVSQISLCGLWSDSRAPTTATTIIALVLTSILTPVLAFTSYLEHVRSVRPSTGLILYLGISALFDGVRIRTVFSVTHATVIPAVLVASLGLKIFLFFLESYEKRALIIQDEKRYPQETTGSIINRSLFLWLNPLFLLGHRNWLTLDLLMPIDSEILTASQPSALYEKWAIANKTSRYALLRVFVLHYKRDLFAGVLPRLAFIGFTFTQPFLIDTFLNLVSQPNDARDRNIEYGLIGGYFIVYLGIAISFTTYEHKTYRVLTLFRGSLISMIYGQVLRTRLSELPDAEAVTLMSADIDRIGQSMRLLHESYASVIELGIGLWLLYLYLGVAMAASTGFILACLLFSIPIASAAGKAQRPWLEAIETRLAATAFVLDSLRTAKMAGLASHISVVLRRLRLSEVAASYRFRLLDALVNVSFHFCSQLSPVIGLGVYCLISQGNSGPKLNEGTAFAALSLFSLLDAPFSTLLTSLEEFQTLTDCFDRIQEHLEAEESNHFNSKGPSYRVRYAEAKHSMQDFRLDELSTSIKCRPLIKSSMIASFKNLSVAYSEDPKNVLQDLDLDVHKGMTTIIMGPVRCGKSTFLKALLCEMVMVTGSITTNFSTAAYCPQTPWMISGSIRENIVGMSAWDATWFGTVAHACDLLKDFRDMPKGADTRVGSNGSTLSGGQRTRVAFARALYSRESVLVLDDVLRGLDSATELILLERIFSPTGLIKQLESTTILATNSIHHCRYADFAVAFDKDGHIIAQGRPEDVLAGSDLKNPASLETRSTAPLDTTGKERKSTDQEFELPLETHEADMARKTGDLKVYLYYLNLIGYKTSFFYFFLCAIFVVGIYGSSVWIQYWTNVNSVQSNDSLSYWVGIYATIAIVAIIASVGSDLLVMVPRTSIKLHEVLLSTTLGSTAAFLTSTETGTIVNRFSQDLELIDNDLPSSFDATMIHVMSTIASAILVFAGSGYVAAVLPLVILLLYIIQAYYLRSSRQLRLLDIEAKAPLFSHFLETLNAVMSIRAYGWIPQYLKRNEEVLNTSQKPYYLMWCIQRWLALVLNLLVCGLATLLVAIAANVQQGSSAYLGVALYNIVSFSMDLQDLIVEWTELETAVGAINRVRAYGASTEQGDEDRSLHEVSEDWPTSGNVVVNNVTATYNRTQHPCLDNLNFAIHAGERLAICGRTGSGKSSFVAALLGMLPLASGTIMIDGVDISSVPCYQLRSRIDTIPQTAFVLPGSVRDNMDPLHSANDEDMVSTLRKIGFWPLIQDKGGLDAPLDQIPLSEGQRQIFGLARAKFGHGKVLILDEINSASDAHNEQLTQSFLREELFPSRTVISIVHKVETVLDFDRIVLLENGCVVETGLPQALLDEQTSRFYSLFRERPLTPPSTQPQESSGKSQ